MRRSAFIVPFILLAMMRAASAATATPAPLATPAPERFSLHVQSTDTQQYHGGFPAAYSGPQSLANVPDTQKTLDVTFFLGTRLWKGGELYFNPELDQGFGLGSPSAPGTLYSGTLGAAGFLSGESYKVGANASYERVQRVFIRQTFNLGGASTSVDPDINQLSGSVATKHVTLTVGKFSTTDIFDNNTYAHDPKNDFLNWSIIDMGAFDYAADSWGYTYGATAEFADTNGALRVGVMQLSHMPNGIAVEHQPFLQYSPIVEYERRTSLFGGHPGSVKVLAYGDDGFFGSYADAVALGAATGASPSTALVRARRFKPGAGVNIAQEVAPHIGVFARASAMNGTYEADEFTEIDRSLSGGVSIDGGLFRRPNDTFGLAAAVNGLSAPAQQYFAAGGLGLLIGDGAQSYGGEQVTEAYYKVGFTKNVAITADYQRVVNPAYNIARGPVSVYGLRYHVQW